MLEVHMQKPFYLQGWINGIGYRRMMLKRRITGWRPPVSEDNRTPASGGAAVFGNWNGRKQSTGWSGSKSIHRVTGGEKHRKRILRWKLARRMRDGHANAPQQIVRLKVAV